MEPKESHAKGTTGFRPSPDGISQLRLEGRVTRGGFPSGWACKCAVAMHIILMWIKRYAQNVLSRLAGMFPACLVTGPRQTGKTSLLRHMFPDAAYLSLDLPSTAETARAAPEELLRPYEGSALIIDEVQYAPSLLRHLKVHIDKDRVPGRYLLTGSQSFPLMEGVSESLAGRCGILNLHSLSFGEACGARDGLDRTEYVARGGYPELYTGAEAGLWYPSYVATYLERDVRNVLNVVDLQSFNRFLRACALRTAQTINYANLARDAGIAPNTARKWLSLLEASSIIVLTDPFFGNRTKRLVKSPKLHFLDTGLAAFLSGFERAEGLFSSALAGAFWESHVAGEIWRHFAFAGRRAPMHFWRTGSGAEVDLVMEHAGGTVAGIGCKLKEQPNGDDAKGLQALADASGERLVERYLVCRLLPEKRMPDGTRVVSLDDFLSCLAPGKHVTCGD